MNCWRDLEVTGILRIALVDHVFSKFIKKGLRKEDILDMMELHGLIVKFSNATDENQDEQRYFVPTQLRSSPSALCEIKPSECDPVHWLFIFLMVLSRMGSFLSLCQSSYIGVRKMGSKTLHNYSTMGLGFSSENRSYLILSLFAERGSSKSF